MKIFLLQGAYVMNSNSETYINIIALEFSRNVQVDMSKEIQK